LNKCNFETFYVVSKFHKKCLKFIVGVGLRQGCGLSPLLFIVYMNWIDRHTRVDEGDTAGFAGSIVRFLRNIWYC